MNSKSKITPIEEDLNQNPSPLIRFLENKKLLLNVFSSILIVGLVLALASRSHQKTQAKQMSVAYTSIDEQGGLLPNIDLEQLRKVAQKNPNLRAYLDAPLAQQYINTKEIKKAASISERINQRLGHNLELNQKMNQLTFLMSQGEDEKALTLAQSLNEQIDRESQPTLYAYHLLRLSYLHKKMDQTSESERYLSEFLAATDKSENQSGLKLGELSISKFLAQR